MSTVAERLHKWALQELNLVSEGGSSRKLPDIESFKKLTNKKNKRIWTYVINHVRSEYAVAEVKRTLYLKKLLKEKDNDATFVNNSRDLAKLKAAISKEKEKHSYLMSSLSTIGERIQNLEQENKKTKDEIFHVNQKVATLELVNQQYDEKNSSVKDLLFQISSYKDSLSAYRSAMAYKSVVDPRDFLFANKERYDLSHFKLKELITVSSSILKQNFNQDKGNTEILIGKFQRILRELKNCGVLLPDIVILLREMCSSELQQLIITNAQCLPIKDFIHSKKKQDPANILLASMKCDNVYNSLSARKTNEEFKRLLIIKEKTFENTFKDARIELNAMDYEIKRNLYEKLSENNALVISIKYLEDFLKDMSSKTDIVRKSIDQKKICNEDLDTVIQTFHKNVDLTFYLKYTTPDAFQKSLHTLNNLQSFACTNLFELPLPPKESLDELKVCFAADRKLTWEYCKKTDLMKPLISEPFDYPLPSDVQKSLNIQPYENINVLCENWMKIKQKLFNASDVEAFVKTDIRVSEVHNKTLEMLKGMEFSIEKGMLFISHGVTHCERVRNLIEEWWDQDAQYIPHVEYEGKTLAMWLSILRVMSDFEPQKYT